MNIFAKIGIALAVAFTYGFLQGTAHGAASSTILKTTRAEQKALVELDKYCARHIKAIEKLHKERPSQMPLLAVQHTDGSISVLTIEQARPFLKQGCRDVNGPKRPELRRIYPPTPAIMPDSSSIKT